MPHRWSHSHQGGDNACMCALASGRGSSIVPWSIRHAGGPLLHHILGLACGHLGPDPEEAAGRQQVAARWQRALRALEARRGAPCSKMASRWLFWLLWACAREARALISMRRNFLLLLILKPVAPRWVQDGSEMALFWGLHVIREFQMQCRRHFGLQVHRTQSSEVLAILFGCQLPG